MKKQLFLIYLTVLTTTIHAQKNDHFVTLTGGVGMQNISYNLPDGKQDGSFGCRFNADYARYFTPNWGVVSGLGLRTAQSVATLNYMTGTSAIDSDGDNYEFRTYFTGWKEKQKSLLLDIPIAGQYMYNMNNKLGLLATAGANIAVSLSTKYKVLSGEMVTTGYFETWNIELSDIPEYGFTSSTTRYKGDTPMKPSLSLFAEIGGMYKLNEEWSIYTGFYADYGLNNILNDNNKPVYGDNQVYNGVLASDNVDKASIFIIGVKIGIRMQWGRKKSPKVVHEEELMKDDKNQLYAQARGIASSVNILFDLNSYKPLNSQEKELESLAEILKQNPEMKLRIVGHTCDIATHEVNIKVGKERAEAVKSILVQMGVSPDQIYTESNASDNPIVPNTSEENRAKNRRVEIFVE